MTSQVLNQLIIIAVIIAVFYFLLIRPQVKRQRERSELIESIKSGDKIVTIGGMFGTVTEIKEDEMMLEVAKNVILKMSKSAIAQKVSET